MSEDPKQRLGKFLQSEQLAASDIVAAIGGVRGLVETTIPALAFLAVYSMTSDLWLSVAVSVGAAALAIVVRAVSRLPLQPAVNGLVAVAISALIALLSGRAEDNYLIGLIGSGVLAGVTITSVIAGWPLIAVVVSFVTGDWSWRTSRRAKYAYAALTLLWFSIFTLRFVVQLPLYLNGDVTALGSTRVIMGTPLTALALVLTWVIVKGLRARMTGTESPA